MVATIEPCGKGFCSVVATKVVTIESCEAFCSVISTTVFHGRDYDLKR